MDLNIELNTKPISPVRLFFPNHTLAIEYDIHIWQQPKCGDTVKYEFDFFNLAAFTLIPPPPPPPTHTHTPSISLTHKHTSTTSAQQSFTPYPFCKTSGCGLLKTYS